MNTLKLVKRGMDFSPHDERVQGSDVGNYRVCTDATSVPAKNGKTYYLEIMRGDKWQTRYTNKRTGKPLAKPVRELVAPSVAFVNACYRDDDGIWWGDTSVWNNSYNTPRPYTINGILDIVNSFAAQHYDAIEFIS